MNIIPCFRTTKLHITSALHIFGMSQCRIFNGDSSSNMEEIELLRCIFSLRLLVVQHVSLIKFLLFIHKKSIVVIISYFSDITDIIPLKVVTRIMFL